MGIKVSYQPPAPVAALGSWLGGFGQFAQEERQRAQALAMERAKMAQQQQQHQDELALRAASMEQNAANQAADNAMRQQQLAMQGQQQQFNNQKDVANFWQDQQKMEMAPIMQEQAAKYQFDRQEAMQKAYQDRAEAQQNAVMQRQEDQQIEAGIRQIEERAYDHIGALKQLELDDPTNNTRNELIAKFDAITASRQSAGNDPQLLRSYYDQVQKYVNELNSMTPKIKSGLKNKPQAITKPTMIGPDGKEVETGNIFVNDERGVPRPAGKFTPAWQLEQEKRQKQEDQFYEFVNKARKDYRDSAIDGIDPGQPGHEEALDKYILSSYHRNRRMYESAFGQQQQMPRSVAPVPQPAAPTTSPLAGIDVNASPSRQPGMTNEQVDKLRAMVPSGQQPAATEPADGTFNIQGTQGFVPAKENEQKMGFVGYYRRLPVLQSPQVALRLLKPGDEFYGPNGKKYMMPGRKIKASDTREVIAEVQ